MKGGARTLARVAVALAHEVQAYGQTPTAAPACLILGGESTVTLGEAQDQGRPSGIALAAALALDGMEGITVIALATDGSGRPHRCRGGLGQRRNRARSRWG